MANKIISQLQWNKNGDTADFVIPINRVYLDHRNTLDAWIHVIENFFANGSFTVWSNVEPASSQTKDWYQTNI